MPGADRPTLTLDDSGLGPTPPAAGVLILALEYRRPLAGSLHIPLEGVDEVLIGRGEERAVESAGGDGAVKVAIRVPDPWMSRAHARLTRFAGHFWVIDLDSKNGVSVAGAPCKKADLGDASEIEIGQTLFYFRQQSGPPPSSIGDPDLFTYHEPLARELEALVRVAGSDIPLLVLGETGTGKELVARRAHALSGRAGELVAVNCASIPQTLIESELFGYRRGAFSGAHRDAVGLVRSADRGTLFLDEIGELPPASQGALLRVLQEGEVTPIGEPRPIKVDLRVIAATNRDLPALVASGQFRRDLYARLSGMIVRLPPLRERREDLGLLIASLLARLAPARETLSFSTEAAHRLFRHSWPFNIRELEKCLATAVTLTDDGVIDLPQLKALDMAVPVEPAEEAQPEAALEGAEADRRARLVDLLRRHRGNVAAVARAFDKAPVQIYRWMKRYRIRPKDFR